MTSQTEMLADLLCAVHRGDNFAAYDCLSELLKNYYANGEPANINEAIQDFVQRQHE